MAQAMTHAGIQGKIVQCIGAVVDVEFPRDHMPRVYDALKLEGSALTLEVQQQLGDGIVRTIALGSSDGLRRGLMVSNTGAPITVPVGKATLGRIMNVIGEPIDEAGPISQEHTAAIHREAPTFSEQAGAAEETVQQIKAKGGEASFVKADTSLAKDNENVVAQSLKRYGGLHIACNNAGIGGPSAPTGEYPMEGWDKVIAVNLTGVFLGLRYQIPALLQSGGGAIVNISSILGQVGFRNAPAYTAAKHGVVGLTKTAAMQYADKNIRINSVGPAFIRTPLLTNALTDEQLKPIEGMHPIGRLGKSEEVAELVLWLSSSRSSFVTGSYYAIDGGYLSQ